MRKLVEEELNELTAPGSLLGKNSARATTHIYPPSDLGRIRFHNNLVEDYIAGLPKSNGDGRAVVITAGPPGAGKSTEIERLGFAKEGWKVIDSDVIKTRLLQKAYEDRIFEDILKRPLADGHPIMLNELIALVHVESTKLADMVLERCLSDQEDVVIEGTLSWEGLPQRYLRKLAEYDYRELTVLDVEVDCETALDQASDRWWRQRCEAISGRGHFFGGRFTPRDAITTLYKAGEQISVCNTNSVNMFRSSQSSHLETFRLLIRDRTNGSVYTEEYISHYGEIEGGVPEPL